MNTVILMWNPAISSFRMEDFKSCIPVLKNHAEFDCYHLDGKHIEIDIEDVEEDEDERQYVEMNWSVWDYKKVKYGDRFFMIRVGEGNTGLVMAGTIDSLPYKGEDWSGKGRETYYCDLDIEAMIDPESMPIITIEELTKAIPGFDWTGGHSGRVLDEDMADKIEVLWQEYLYRYFTVFDFKRGANTVAADVIPNAFDHAIRKKLDDACEICGYNNKKIWGEEDKEDENDEFYNNSLVRYVPRSPDVRCQNGDNMWKHIHCVCMNCNRHSYEAVAKKLGEKDYICYED